MGVQLLQHPCSPYVRYEDLFNNAILDLGSLLVCESDVVYKTEEFIKELIEINCLKVYVMRCVFDRFAFKNKQIKC